MSRLRTLSKIERKSGKVDLIVLVFSGFEVFQIPDTSNLQSFAKKFTRKYPENANKLRNQKSLHAFLHFMSLKVQTKFGVIWGIWWLKLKKKDAKICKQISPIFLYKLMNTAENDLTSTDHISATVWSYDATESILERG